MTFKKGFVFGITKKVMCYYRAISPKTGIVHAPEGTTAR